MKSLWNMMSENISSARERASNGPQARVRSTPSASPTRPNCAAFADLGMEAIYEFTVEDMPVTVAVDATGTSVHQTGPAEWSQKIAAIAVRR